MGLFFDILLGLASGGGEKKKKHHSWEGMSDMFADAEFKDYRDKRGYDNDHNWEADGDMRWDTYDD